MRRRDFANAPVPKARGAPPESSAMAQRSGVPTVNPGLDAATPSDASAARPGPRATRRSPTSRASSPTNRDDPEALELLGLCHIRLGEPGAALASAARGARDAPERAHLHYLLGFAASQRAEADDAERALRRGAAARARRAGLPARARRAAAPSASGTPRRWRWRGARWRWRRSGAANHRHARLRGVGRGADRAARAQPTAGGRARPADATAWNNLGCVAMAGQAAAGARALPRGAAARPARRARAAQPEPGGRRRRGRRAIYDDWEAFLGEVLRELCDAGRRVRAAGALDGARCRRSAASAVRARSRARRGAGGVGAAGAAVGRRCAGGAASARAGVGRPLGVGAAARASAGWRRRGG